METGAKPGLFPGDSVHLERTRSQREVQRDGREQRDNRADPEGRPPFGAEPKPETVAEQRAAAAQPQGLAERIEDDAATAKGVLTNERGGVVKPSPSPLEEAQEASVEQAQRALERTADILLGAISYAGVVDKPGVESAESDSPSGGADPVNVTV